MKYKTLIISGIILIICILCLIKLPSSLSRFNSSIDSEAKSGIAFYVIESNYQTKEINLDKITPSDTPYLYNFSVANYNEEKRLETKAEYHIVIRTTTNLNLEYELYENNSKESAIVSRELVTDKDGTYYYVMKTDKEYFNFNENQINYYTLSVKFPLEYSNYEYQNIIESLEIIILSSQVMD